MAETLKVVGGRRLRSAMRKAGVDLTELRDVNRKVAGIVASEAKTTAPVASGRLAGDVRALGSRTSATVKAGRGAVPYAGVIHWGWPNRGIDAQPWVSEAAQATEPTWQNVYMDYINQAIEQIEGARPSE